MSKRCLFFPWQAFVLISVEVDAYTADGFEVLVSVCACLCVSVCADVEAVWSRKLFFPAANEKNKIFVYSHHILYVYVQLCHHNQHL